MTHKFLNYHGLSAREFLLKLEEETDFLATAPIDLEKIISHIGVEIDYSVDLDKISTAGSVSINDKNALIWINPLENAYEPRKRFTVAHEIGHLVRHIKPENGVKEFIDTKKTLNRMDSYWDSKEYEANNFAAQLLMPQKLLKQHGNQLISEYKGENEGKNMPLSVFIKKMATLFNVSEPAMNYRLKKIKAI